MPITKIDMSFLPSSNKQMVALSPEGGKVLHILGDTLTIKVSGEETNGEFAIIHEVSPPQGGPPLHVHHREDEAFYVLDGEYEVQFGDRTIPAVPGSFIFAPRDIPHAFKHDLECSEERIKPEDEFVLELWHYWLQGT
jgi:quercetin dioxygenase-like cupin family protein